MVKTAGDGGGMSKPKKKTPTTITIGKGKTTYGPKVTKKGVTTQRVTRTMPRTIVR